MISLWRHKRFPDVVYALIPTQAGSDFIAPVLICIGEEPAVCSCHETFAQQVSSGVHPDWALITTIDFWTLQPVIKSILEACAQHD